MNSLKKYQKNAILVSTKWVFRYKYNSDNTINKRKATYLNAILNKEIYMEVPEGLEGYRKGYLKLKKTLYWLKQSGLLWNQTLNNELCKIGLIRLRSE